MINDAVSDVLIGKVGRERVGEEALRRVERVRLKDLRTRAALVNRIASRRIRLLTVQSIGEHVAAHVGFELAPVERNRPRNVRRRARAVGLADHVVSKLVSRGSRDRAALGVTSTAPLPRCRVFRTLLLFNEFTVFRGYTTLQLGFICNRMVSLGKAAQVLASRNLAINRRLWTELHSVEHKTAVHKFEVVAQRIGELDVRGIRLDSEFNGPGDFGHAVGALRENPRLLPLNVTVLGGNIDLPHAGEHNRRHASRTNVLVFKLKREVRRDINVRRVFFEPRLVERKNGLVVFNLPCASSYGIGARSRHKVHSGAIVDGYGVRKLVNGNIVPRRRNPASLEICRKSPVKG